MVKPTIPEYCPWCERIREARQRSRRLADTTFSMMAMSGDMFSSANRKPKKKEDADGVTTPTCLCVFQDASAGRCTPLLSLLFFPPRDVNSSTRGGGCQPA